MAPARLPAEICQACVADMRSLMISGPFKAASYLRVAFGVEMDLHRCLDSSGHMPEAARPQLAIGPQKCVVMGPVGELMKAALSGPSPSGLKWAKLQTSGLQTSAMAAVAEGQRGRARN